MSSRGRNLSFSFMLRRVLTGIRKSPRTERELREEISRIIKLEIAEVLKEMTEGIIEDQRETIKGLKGTIEIGTKMIDILTTRRDSINPEEMTSREEITEETKIEIINLNKVKISGNFIMELSKARSVEDSITNQEVSLD